VKMLACACIYIYDSGRNIQHALPFGITIILVLVTRKLISKDKKKEVFTSSAGMLKLSIYVFIQFIKRTSLLVRLKFVFFLYNSRYDI
jgi:hypothetical protein